MRHVLKLRMLLWSLQVTQHVLLPDDVRAERAHISYTNITLGSNRYSLQTLTLKHYGLSDTFDRSITFLLQVGATANIQASYH
jgi:hypothetical protein